MEILETSFLLQILTVVVNKGLKSTKYELRLKLKVSVSFKEKNEISEIFEFSVLALTQDWKLGNLRDLPFVSNIDSGCN